MFRLLKPIYLSHYFPFHFQFLCGVSVHMNENVCHSVMIQMGHRQNNDEIKNYNLQNW